MLRIANFFSVPVSYLYGDTNDIEDRSRTHYTELAAQKVGLDDKEKYLIETYRSLDTISKKVVDSVMNLESQRGTTNQPRTATRSKVIPLFGTSFAAGSPEPDFGNAWQKFYVEKDNPADFAIKVNGESMQPYINDGDIILGENKRPQDGDVGAFMLDGGFLVKQFCEDNFGNIYLFSLNRDHKDIIVGHDQTLKYIGTIIMPRKIPLPLDINV
jgi:phage repressor protein C with HTH and peptisase S24 domain